MDLGLRIHLCMYDYVIQHNLWVRIVLLLCWQFLMEACLDHILNLWRFPSFFLFITVGNCDKIHAFMLSWIIGNRMTLLCAHCLLFSIVTNKIIWIVIVDAHRALDSFYLRQALGSCANSRQLNCCLDQVLINIFLSIWSVLRRLYVEYVNGVFFISAKWTSHFSKGSRR